MLKKLFARKSRQIQTPLNRADEQRLIDILRHDNADRPMMQLHLDRCQNYLDRRNALAA